MKYYTPPYNKSFIGRASEIKRLDKIMQNKTEAKIFLFYGRRRIGKTELIEHYFREMNLLKFEGIQTEDEVESPKLFQMESAIRKLADYTENFSLRKITPKCWTDFFEELHPHVVDKKVTLYFEEVQWLCCYKNDFFAELKPFWDNYWRHNKNLNIIICGSSTSFILQNIMFNQALYSRDQEEFHIKEFNLQEIQQFLKKIGPKETLQAAITLGGIPGYLKRLPKKEGTFLSSLAEISFTKDAYLLNEYDKIFVSRMSEYKHYKKAIEYLSKVKSASSIEIYKAVTGLKTPTVSGKFIEILDDLISCGFIAQYRPLTKSETSKLSQYRIQDEYLHYYYKFIRPIKLKIQGSFFEKNPLSALNKTLYEKALGFSFERWCIKNVILISSILKIDQLKFESGAYFSRSFQKKQKGYQIDLMFIVENSKIIFCEIKYYQLITDKRIDDELNEKIRLFISENPKYKNLTIEKALIIPEGATEKVVDQFDHIITLNDLLDKIV